MYLIYDIETKVVVEIKTELPEIKEGYDYCISGSFQPGDEFDKLIIINKINKDTKSLISHSYVLQSLPAKTILQEIAFVKDEIQQLRDSMDKDD